MRDVMHVIPLGITGDTREVIVVSYYLRSNPPKSYAWNFNRGVWEEIEEGTHKDNMAHGTVLKFPMAFGNVIVEALSNIPEVKGRPGEAQHIVMDEDKLEKMINKPETVEGTNNELV